VLFACLFHFAPWERVWRPAADLTRHAVALMSGGFLATLFACWGFLGLLVGAAVTAAYARWSPKSASRPWVDPARISLAWCTAAVPIVLNLI
jgi:hypothetical protein